MIISKDKEAIIGSKSIRKSEMKIDVSKKTFQMLGTQIYQYPIRAIIREIITNALDAHKDVGTSRRVLVSLPTDEKPLFTVRDYGKGMSEDEMFDNYSVFFRSSKDESNEFIGALGIGSKSPLGYADNFSIISRNNGSKKIYRVSIMTGYPELELLSVVENCDEHSGLEVIVPVVLNDIEKFHEEYINITNMFNKEDIPETLLSSEEIVEMCDHLTVCNMLPHTIESIRFGDMFIVGNRPIKDYAYPQFSNMPKNSIKSYKERKRLNSVIDLKYKGELAVNTFKELDQDKYSKSLVIDRSEFKFNDSYSHINSYKFEYTNMFKSRFNVRMGNILYPIDVNSFLKTIDEDVLGLRNINDIGYIILDMNLGDCDIAPNRESIFLNEETIENIERSLIESKLKYEESISNAFSEGKYILANTLINIGSIFNHELTFYKSSINPVDTSKFSEFSKSIIEKYEHLFVSEIDGGVLFNLYNKEYDIDLINKLKIDDEEYIGTSVQFKSDKIPKEILEFYKEHDFITGKNIIDSGTSNDKGEPIYFEKSFEYNKFVGKVDFYNNYRSHYPVLKNSNKISIDYHYTMSNNFIMTLNGSMASLKGVVNNNPIVVYIRDKTNGHIKNIKELFGIGDESFLLQNFGGGCYPSLNPYLYLDKLEMLKHFDEEVVEKYINYNIHLLRTMTKDMKNVPVYVFYTSEINDNLKNARVKFKKSELSKQVEVVKKTTTENRYFKVTGIYRAEFEWDKRPLHGDDSKENILKNSLYINKINNEIKDNTVSKFIESDGLNLIDTFGMVRSYDILNEDGSDVLLNGHKIFRDFRGESGTINLDDLEKVDSTLNVNNSIVKSQYKYDSYNRLVEQKSDDDIKTMVLSYGKPTSFKLACKCSKTGNMIDIPLVSNTGERHNTLTTFRKLLNVKFPTRRSNEMGFRVSELISIEFDCIIKRIMEKYPESNLLIVHEDDFDYVYEKYNNLDFYKEHREEIKVSIGMINAIANNNKMMERISNIGDMSSYLDEIKNTFKEPQLWIEAPNIPISIFAEYTNLNFLSTFSMMTKYFYQNHGIDELMKKYGDDGTSGFNLFHIKDKYENGISNVLETIHLLNLSNTVSHLSSIPNLDLSSNTDVYNRCLDLVKFNNYLELDSVKEIIGDIDVKDSFHKFNNILSFLREFSRNIQYSIFGGSLYVGKCNEIISDMLQHDRNEIETDFILSLMNSAIVKYLNSVTVLFRELSRFKSLRLNNGDLDALFNSKMNIGSMVNMDKSKLIGYANSIVCGNTQVLDEIKNDKVGIDSVFDIFELFKEFDDSIVDMDSMLVYIDNLTVETGNEYYSKYFHEVRLNKSYVDMLFNNFIMGS